MNFLTWVLLMLVLQAPPTDCGHDESCFPSHCMIAEGQ